MATDIHPTAIVDPRAELGDGVSVGPFSVIGPDVKIGANTKIWHQANVWGNTSIGEGCEFFPFASVGMQTQDMKFNGGNPGTRIGDRNVIREYVSINAATNDGEYTEIGDDNLFLAYCHVGHCCKIGNHLIASNGATFAGHVVVEDHVGIGGGGTAIHQFCHIGQYSFIGGCAKVEQDIPPFMLGDGHPAKIRMFNKVGLERSGFDANQIQVIKQLFKLFYRQGLNRQQAIEAIKSSDIAEKEEVKTFVAFAESSERGLAGGS
ncbi:MAG: acyl-ACP--UDP-N-acetylglucosamine O-acyltransferase [Opitutaceae bacterium]|jgi:UDP-N-acetylglucosamine acyltransferase|nr:acyl-ACP--UDP-N-acetylglucosamine O-acyltransferase [Opitutaceae bacterium]|tara:strand:- start:2214 stop:3002 length:789 start_codon:yes stop_codon:yes gene_type:complete